MEDTEPSLFSIPIQMVIEGIRGPYALYHTARNVAERNEFLRTALKPTSTSPV
eukprot:COSAG02_NODE_6864_length_3318_cov_1.732526_4_plen_53_part_00